MLAYILRRILLIVPTLFAIILVNFVIVQAAPGGPVEQTILRIRHSELDATSRISGVGASDVGANQAVDFEIAIVTEHDPLPRIRHHHALAEVIQGGTDKCISA